MIVKIINFDDINKDIINLAKKERLTFCNKTNCIYFGLFENNLLISFSALVLYKNKNAKIKSNYTLKEYRKRGYFTYLNNYILNYIKNNLNIKNIYLNCTNFSYNIHIKAGAKLIKESKLIKYLVYNLEI